MTVDTAQTIASPPSDRPTSEGRTHRRRRGARTLGIVALALIGLLFGSTATNLIQERVERSVTAPYGHRVKVDGGSLNVYRNGHSGPPLVLLSGLGTAAPALDFAPLIRRLGAFDVIVVEGLGYGYSDMTARPRTVENISAELHEVLSRLDIERPYTLVGHSISGFYTLYYANKYPKEVSAVIGIDPTVPAGKVDAPSVPSGGVNPARLASTTGLARGLSAVAPALLGEPEGGAYTASERRRIHLMTSWNFGNDAVANEMAQIGRNARRLQGMTYPDGLPVLTFLAADSVATIPRWREMHDDQVKNVERHEIMVLRGQHYLHWTQSAAMAAKITDFLGGGK
ncbi:alpha/beta fold hydrolase [Lacisediminihabitans sp.]|uniref:alpha/beta fold hydrolase n=1 Tax=Lacisediminihabitans sp. TaxID=2787631 RepID=UPI00374DECE0